MGAAGAATFDGEVGEVDLEATCRTQPVDQRPCLVGRELPAPAAARADEMTVIRRRVDVELLAPLASVAVADEPDLLEHVERPVHGRRGRRRVDRPAALDQVRARDVAVNSGQDLEQDAPLRRPAQPARAEPAADVGPAIRRHDPPPNSQASIDGSFVSSPSRKIAPTTRLNVPATTPMTTYMRCRKRLAMNPVAVMKTTIELATRSPMMNASIIGNPRPCVDAPPMAAISSTCVPVSAPTPWIIPTPYAVRTPYDDISMGSTCSCPCTRASSRRQAKRT